MTTVHVVSPLAVFADGEQVTATGVVHHLVHTSTFQGHRHATCTLRLGDGDVRVEIPPRTLAAYAGRLVGGFPPAVTGLVDLRGDVPVLSARRIGG